MQAEAQAQIRGVGGDAAPVLLGLEGAELLLEPAGTMSSAPSSPRRAAASVSWKWVSSWRRRMSPRRSWASELSGETLMRRSRVSTAASQSCFCCCSAPSLSRSAGSSGAAPRSWRSSAMAASRSSEVQDDLLRPLGLLELALALGEVAGRWAWS